MSSLSFFNKYLLDSGNKGNFIKALMIRLSKKIFFLSVISSIFILQGCYAHSKVTGKDLRITRVKDRTADPLEPFNRIIFGFNQGIDTLVIKPAATIYKEGAPEFVQKGLRNFLRNLKSPTTFGNHLLQGQGNRAGKTVGRFIVNTTVGVGGLFDVADKMGMHYEAADFGQTLGVWGASSGPYLVLPLLGPSSIRDGVGLAADSYVDPLNRYAANTDRDWILYTRLGLTILDKRAEHLDMTNDLERNSLDYYAALRSVYLQNRKAFVDKGKGITPLEPDSEGNGIEYPDYPDYDDEDIE